MPSGFATLDVQHEGHNSLVDRQSRDNVFVNSDHHFRVAVVWRQLQHALVIVISAERISKRGIPRLLDQAFVYGGKGTCNPARIKRVHVVGLGFQSLFGELEGLLGEILYAHADIGVDEHSFRAQKIRAKVKFRIESALAIDFSNQDDFQKVIYGEGIVRMRLQGFLETLYRGIVVAIIETIESFASCRVVRPELERYGGRAGSARKNAFCGQEKGRKRKRIICWRKFSVFEENVYFAWGEPRPG